LATSSGSTSLADRARHRIALRLLPFLFLLYVIAFLDRTNISSAALEMPRELGFNDKIVGIGSGIFFLGYLLLEIPGAVIVERWSARRWLARIMVTWGLVTVWMAFIHTPRQFYTVRFLLGAAEAGFFPGVIVYLTHWFPPRDRAKAVANFMAAVPISQVVGAPLAGWILGVHWLGLSGWRWLFVLEGLPALLLGVITYFYLTDRPRHAHWLPVDEQDWIVDQLEAEKQTKKFAPSIGFFRAVVHWEVITLTFTYFVQVVAAFAFIFWLPVMVKRVSGLSNFKVLLLAALPWLFAFLTMQINGWHSDRSGERRWHAALPLFLSSAALVPLVFLNLGTIPAIVLFTLVVGLVMAFLPCFWPMPAALLSGSAAAATIGLINSIGLLGGFIGPSLMGYFSSRTHSFKTSFACMMVSLAVAGVLTLTLRVDRPARP
jgi:ACS family tartrate transporter-like MFS transporter